MNSSDDFQQKNADAIKDILSRYPKDLQTSAIMPLLTLAQDQNNGWLDQKSIQAVSEILSMPFIKVYEVASFYSMYNLKPVGKYLIELCRTTPCWLKGCGKVAKAFEDELGIKMNQTTEDNLFTLREIECLGACINAPVVKINDNYAEDVTPEKVKDIIQDLKNRTN